MASEPGTDDGSIAQVSNDFNLEPSKSHFVLLSQRLNITCWVDNFQFHTKLRKLNYAVKVLCN